MNECINMKTARLKYTYLFFSLIIFGLFISLVTTTLLYKDVLHQCKGEFTLPKNAYWERDCWWSCRKGFIRDVENSVCKTDPNIK